MSVLRVLVLASPAAAQRVPWAAYDAQNRLVRSGAGTPAEWPAMQSREAVLGAAAVRLARVVLPPLPADRVAAAARFALEDQLAGSAQTQHIVTSPQRKDGSVEVTIAARAPFAALQSQFARVVAEPAIAPLPAPRTWRWYESAAGGGFVRRPDGSAFAVSAPMADAPPEIALAAAHAARTRALERVEVAFAIDDERLRAWSRQCGVPFERVAAWHWDQDGASLGAATDLLQDEFSRAPRARTVTATRRFRFALGLAAAALALHVGASFVEWASLRYDMWDTQRRTVATARAAGVTDAADSNAAAAGLSRRFTDARHRALLAAPADALPLLARAAPALAALPPGALKTATYASGTWTFDVGKLDAGRASGLERNLELAGLATLSATTPAGTRVRVSPAPGTERP